MDLLSILQIIILYNSILYHTRFFYTIVEESAPRGLEKYQDQDDAAILIRALALRSCDSHWRGPPRAWLRVFKGS